MGVDVWPSILKSAALNEAGVFGDVWVEGTDVLLVLTKPGCAACDRFAHRRADVLEGFRGARVVDLDASDARVRQFALTLGQRTVPALVHMSAGRVEVVEP